MLVVALLLGAMSVVLFSQMFLQAWLPWEAVSQANQASVEAAAAAAEAAGTQGEAAAQAEAEAAAAEAAATEVSAQEAVRTGLLVVAYRRQKTLEEQEGPRQRTRLMTERFREAATQLGSAAPATRLAGVYAMAALADEWDEQQQQCIDVLCAYLRLPYQPPVQLQRLGHGRRRVGDPTPGGGEDSVLAERQVRTTVVRVIRDHLQPGATHSWEGRNFNFEGAHFDDADFTGARFSSGRVDFSRTEFTDGRVSFVRAQFSGSDVRFEGAEFSGSDVFFAGAQFSAGRVDFYEAQFSGGTVDFGAKFKGAGVRFSHARFSGSDVFFAGAEFSAGHVGFDKAQFAAGKVDFMWARVSGGYVGFKEAQFTGGTVDFSRAQFTGGTVDFSRAQFTGGGDKATVFVHPDGSKHDRPPDLPGAAQLGGEEG